MEAALEAGADDVLVNEDGSIEVLTGPASLAQVRQAMAAGGLQPEFAEVTMRPETQAELQGEDGQKMQKLLDALESLDDVQEVYTNVVIL
jgi:transcriptional/translational regulatory protein YebC/TACO1